MVNGYIRQLWKEVEEPTQKEKINTKKKHYAFRQTTRQVQTSAAVEQLPYPTVSRRLHLKSGLPKCIVLLFSIYFLTLCEFL